MWRIDPSVLILSPNTDNHHDDNDHNGNDDDENDDDENDDDENDDDESDDDHNGRHHNTDEFLFFFLNCKIGLFLAFLLRKKCKIKKTKIGKCWINLSHWSLSWDHYILGTIVCAGDAALMKVMS